MSDQAAERAGEKGRHEQLEDSKDVADAARNVEGQQPFRRRMLPALALFFWMVSLPMSVCLFFMLCSVPLLWPLIVPYVIWIFFDTAPETGGRRAGWMRRLVLWRWLVKYFPASLIKTAELPKERRYLFGYHPHGIIGLGAVSCLGTEGAGFAEKFPGIRMHVLTLATNFQLPVFRDFLMSIGFCSVSRNSCESILRKRAGNAITIVVGGAAESLNARPGYMDLTLRNRLGFIRIAMRTGADLVPTIGFGENDLYDQVDNEPETWLYKFQVRFKSLFGWTMPMFLGRGLLHRNLGWMPYMRPLYIVVGAPIQVPHIEHPTKEQLREVQQRYISALTALYDQYKDKYAPHRFEDLRIVE